MPPEAHLIVDEATPALTNICAGNFAILHARKTSQVVQAAISYWDAQTMRFMAGESRSIHAFGQFTE